MAATRLRFHSNGNGTVYIDLARALSLQNRKLHRQKMIYTVYGGYYVDSNGSRINLNVAPNTWPVKRAINRGFAQWRKMIAKTLSNIEGGATGKYSDFKIYLNQGQSGGATSTLPPVDGNATSLAVGTLEWNYSTLTSEDPDGPGGTPPDQFDLHIVGPHAGSSPNWSRIGLLQSWVNSRPKPDMETPEDTPLAVDPLSNLFDAGDADDDRTIIINQENDAPPYDDDTMFGLYSGSYDQKKGVQRVSTAITTAANAIMPIHGFEAICGLVQLEVSGDPGDWELVLDVEAKGVKF